MANEVADLTDNFDIDSFDWGEDEPLLLADVSPQLDEIMQDAIAAAHTKIFGWRYAKRGEMWEPSQKVFPVNYVVPNPEHRKKIEDTWPEYAFQWGAAKKHTDHPVSRLGRELTEMEMVQPLLASDTPYIDLFGSGARNGHYGRKCLTLFTLATPKDYLSYQKRSFGEKILDWDRLIKGQYLWRGKRIHHVTMTHSLYYLNLEKISQFVNAHPDNRVHATVHRHMSSHGFLNEGEQEYWVDENGDVTQMNVNTGETYKHPSLEAMFHQFSAKTRSGGVAWTARNVGSDTYLIELVGCPNEIALDWTPLQFLQPETRTVTSHKHLMVKTFLHWTWMVYSSSANSKVLLDNVDLLEDLRLYIAGRQRTPKEKASLWNYCRRLCNERDIISMHGGKVRRIDQALMVDYVECAFYMDARRELEVACSYAKDNSRVVAALNKYYETGVAPTDVSCVDYAVKTVVGTACEAIFWPVGTGVSMGKALFDSDSPRRLENHGKVRAKNLAEKQMRRTLKLAQKSEVLIPCISYT